MEVMTNQGTADGSRAARNQLATLLNQDQRWHDKVVAESDQERLLRFRLNIAHGDLTVLGPAMSELGILTNE